MKRFTTIFLGAILSCSMAVSSLAAMESNGSPWALPALETGYEAGFVTNAELQSAKAPMSRLNACKMMMRFLRTVTGQEWSAKKDSPFQDCQDADVIAAYEAGIIGGTDPGVFAPQNTLTREQVAILITRMLRVCGVDLTEKAQPQPFTDTKELYRSSQVYIDQLYGAKIIAGYKDNTYRPFQKMTVEEAVVAFVQAYQYIRDNGGITPSAEQGDDGEKKVVSYSGKESERISIKGKTVGLHMSVEQLKETWGEPSRIDETVYGLKRYVYINEYKDYFFVTLKDEKVGEIFVPGMDFRYMGVKGGDASADIRNLSRVSTLDHSGIITTDTTEARLPMDYLGEVSGILLQSTDFIREKKETSTLTNALRTALEAELLDMIQVKRTEAGLPLLSIDSNLVSTARNHSEDMIRKNYFDYNSPDGTTPFARIAERGKTFFTASEVIAQQRGDVVNIYPEWMRTVGKKNNIVDETMQEVGVGVASGGKVLYVTVDFCGHQTTNS